MDTSLSSSIAERLHAVRTSMQAAALAAGRDPASVSLVAVSKFHPLQSVQEALAANQCVFGENRVQEAAAKFPPLRPT
ncbi:MAG: YggS family pyridoxal phosphate-dependent enzyme, partial [Acetobacter okinawensis]